jgi:AcrR family transcriptional regulator
LTRAQQAGRNRALVLAAARRVFLARGYHGATLEQIADAAGFSKGVVYSQFRGKADLFLALLENRIEERAQQNARLARDAAGGGLTALLDHLIQVDKATREWLLLVIEFRVHAARDPGLNQRYAAAHARSVEAVATALAIISERAGGQFPLPLHQLAELLMALSTGGALEEAAHPGSLETPHVAGLLATLLEPAALATPAGTPAGSSLP